MNRIMSFLVVAALAFTGCGGSISYFKGRVTSINQGETTGDTISGFGVAVFAGDEANELIIDDLLSDVPVSAKKTPDGALTILPGEHTSEAGSSSWKTSFSGTGSLSGQTLTVHLTVTRTNVISGKTTTSTSTIDFTGTKL